MKPEAEFEGLRIAGVEDGSFEAFDRERPQKTLLCCVCMKGDSIEGVGFETIEVDGLDATGKLLNMLNRMGCGAVILGGITFAGFNVVDPRAVSEGAGVPVVVYSGEEPDNDAVLRALMGHFGDWERRWGMIRAAGEVHATVPGEGEPPVYFEVVGAPVRWAEGLLRYSAKLCRIPEPVRAAGILARGLSSGA